MAASDKELRQILQEDGAGKNLYDHLTETLMRLVLDRPGNAYDDFERISAEVKLNPLNPNPIKGTENPFTEKEAEKKIAHKDASVALMKTLEAPAENQGCAYPDLLSEAGILEWAGVSLGKAETYRLYLSIKALADRYVNENN